MARKLCIVTRSRKKIWDKDPNAGPVKARDAYIGPLARKAVEYAERFCKDGYVILSAKHGFLSPDDIVPGNYNTSFTNPKTNPISIEELKRQAEEKGLTRYDEIVVLAGKAYLKVVEEVFRGKRIRAPLKGLRGIGYMLKALKKAIEENREL